MNRVIGSAGCERPVRSGFRASITYVPFARCSGQVTGHKRGRHLGAESAHLALTAIPEASAPASGLPENPHPSRRMYGNSSNVANGCGVVSSMTRRSIPSP